MTDYIKQVTVTGDISRIGDQDDVLRSWASEVAKEIAEQKPEFAVVHVQGLLNSRDPDYTSRALLGVITDNPTIYKHFNSSRAFFDTRLTGLGSLFLFRNHEEVFYYDRFSNTGFLPLPEGHRHYIGDAECEGFVQNTFNQQYSFRKDFYRDDGSRDLSQQRTGFLLARFRIYSKEMTFVNVNLHSLPFEDINEIMEHPEVTKAAQKRQEQIEFLLRELDEEGLREDAIIVGGAFNAQLHETELLGHLEKTQRLSTVAKKDEQGRVEALEHVDRHGRQVTTVEKSRFDLHSIHDWFFRLGRGQMAKRYNGELAATTFKGALLEEAVFFQPSRHYVLTEEGKEEYTRTMCPAWADRILYNKTMDELFRHVGSRFRNKRPLQDSFCASGLYYGLVGESTFVGQHKPVALHASICLK